jgi:predicted ATP-grasp superfamily ATP-dependent carboligase
MIAPHHLSPKSQITYTDVLPTQPIAVVVGLCGHGLAVVRALNMGFVPIIALEANSELPGVQTRLASIEMIPDINGVKLIESLIELRTRIDCVDSPVLFLTNDRMIRTIAEGWFRLEGLYKLSWSHARHTLLPFLEKASLEPRCDSQGLSYPKTFVLTTAADVDQAIATIGFPIFVKPARPLSQFKTAQPQTREALHALANAYSADLPFLIQQCIPGDDTCIYFTAFYLDHGNILARFDGHKLRSRPLGHTTIAESSPNDEVCAQTCKFFAGLNLSGPVSLELKKDQMGRFWVIEPTIGRTDFWIDLCVANDVNLPLIEYQNQAKLQFMKPTQSNKAVWFNEDRDPFGRLWFISQKNMNMGTRRATYLYMHGTDIQPALRALKAIGKALINSVANRLKRLRIGPAGNLPSDVQCFGPSEHLPPDVQQLFENAEAEDIEFGLAWHNNLVKTVYLNNPGIYIYVLRENGLPIAALPVKVLDKAFGKSIESVSNYYTTLCAPALAVGVTAASLSKLISSILNNNTNAGSIRLAPLNPLSKSYITLTEAFRLAGLVPRHFFCFGNWFQNINEDWCTYLNSREGQLRHTLQRKKKKFAAANGTLEIITSSIDLARGLAAYEHVYARSWKRPEPYPEFMPNLMNVCADRGWLRLGIAWLDDKAIAAQFWIVANGKASIYKLAYDKHFKAYAPGTVLSAMLMEHVIEKDKVTEVDYLIGDDPYKKTWMSQRRERWGIIGYNPKSIRGFFGLGKETIGKWLKPMLIRINELAIKRNIHKSH